MNGENLSKPIILLLCCAIFSNAQVGTTYYSIQSVAGSYSIGDNGPATAALLFGPTGAAFDPAGNIFVADNRNSRIRKITAQGTITTLVAGMRALDIAVDATGSNIYALTGNSVYRISPQGAVTLYAGNGREAFGGDGGPARNASIDASALAVDTQGQLFIADYYNSRVRKVAADGTMTTVAGTGDFGFSGDGGPATEARLYGPDGVAVDRNGNLYISDSINHRIRRVTAAGIITTYAGTGTAGVSGDGNPASSAQIPYPARLAVDTGGNLYFSSADIRIRRVAANGIMQAFAGTGDYGFAGDGGPALGAVFGNGYANLGLALDAQNNLSILDVDNDRIRRVDSSGVINTTAGAGHYSGDNGPATAAVMKYPTGAVVDRSGTVYLTDTENHRIRAISPQGVITTFLGNGLPVFADGPIAAARTTFPRGMALDAGGTFFFTDGSHRVRKITPSGIVSTSAGTGSAGFSGDNSPATVARLNRPFNLAVDGNNNVYFADTSNHRVRRISADGVITTVAGNGTAGFSGDSGPGTQARLAFPRGVALDRNGNLYIADSSNQRIRRVNATGVITTVAGNGQCCSTGDNGPALQARLGTPYAIAFDPAGNLFVADWLGNQIRRVSTSGIITNIAGNGDADFSGDNGPAITAAMNGPSSLSVDAAGVIYFCDRYNHRIRKLLPLVPTALTILSGDRQTAPVASAAPAPLVVKVVARDGTGVPGVAITMAVLSGEARLSTDSVITGLDGTASVNVTLGAAPGEVTVRAIAAGLQPVIFTLTATTAVAAPQPRIQEGGVVSGGLSVPPLRTIAPGSRVIVMGTDFTSAGTDILLASNDLMTAALGGVCLTIGGKPALLYSISPTRIGAIAPDAGSGDLVAQVTSRCGTPDEQTSNPEVVAMQPYSPEFFYAGPGQDGKRPALLVNSEGQPLSTAAPGDTVGLSLTGLGALADSFTLTVAGRPVPEEDVSLTAGFAGAYTLQFRLSQDLEAGEGAVSLSIGGISTADGVFIVIGTQSARLLAR